MSQTLEQTDLNPANNDKEKKAKSRRPANTAFRQQRLKAWQPILTPKTVIPLLFAVGIIFAPIGGGLLYASTKVQELRIDYTDCNTTAPACPSMSTIPSDKVSAHFKSAVESVNAPKWCRTMTQVPIGNGSHSIPTPICHLQYDVPDNLTAPVLLYYQLTNFYQNHRRYVQSYDQAQLKGTYVSASTIDSSTCNPLKLNEDGIPYYPCGLIANSLFNDTFFEPVLLDAVGTSKNNVTYAMTSNGTAWASDKDLYGESPYNTSEVVPPPDWHDQYPFGYNEDYPIPNLHTWDAFQVWMRTAGLPTFSKLTLRNDDDTMPSGRYETRIYDYYPVTKYGGTKSILLSTRTVIGGKNPFLGIAYIVVGGLCILLGALFTATQLIRPRKLGDHSYLSWNTDQPSTATTTGRSPRPGEGA